MRLAMRATAFLVRAGDAFRIFNMRFSWAVPNEVANAAGRELARAD